MKKNSLTVAAFAALALSLGACGASTDEPAPAPSAQPSTPAPSATPTDAPTPKDTDIKAAEETVRGFFAVKGKADEPLNVKIEEQAKFLTSRDVHPAAAYVDPESKDPSGVTELETAVTLKPGKRAGGKIQIPFETKTDSESFLIVDGKLEKGHPEKAWSTWDGTATLVNVGGKWLIEEMTMDHIGGGIGDPADEPTK